MSLKRRCIHPASTKRAVIVGGRRENPTEHLTRLRCTRLFPADSGRAGALVERDVIQSIVNVKEVVVMGNHDILPGDRLVYGAEEFVIHGAAPWQRPTCGTYFMYLTIEKILQ
jgi:hypothetical protein